MILHSANSGCEELGIRVTTVCEICGFNHRASLLPENVSPPQSSNPVTPFREKEHSRRGQDRQLLSAIRLEILLRRETRHTRQEPQNDASSPSPAKRLPDCGRHREIRSRLFWSNPRLR